MERKVFLRLVSVFRSRQQFGSNDFSATNPAITLLQGYAMVRGG